MKLPYILFFIDGPFPSDSEKAHLANVPSAQVVFRNALAVPPENHALETCDGVMGKVPPIYAKTFPTAEFAVTKYQAEIKALSAKVGDSPAPRPAPHRVPVMPESQGPWSGPAPQQQAGNLNKPPAWNPNPSPSA